MSKPIEKLDYPVKCGYTGCGEGPFYSAEQVDEHITENHLPEAIWTFAIENMDYDG